MMSLNSQKFLTAAVATIIAGLFAAILAPAGFAASVDTSEWTCEFCPFESGYRGDYDVGASNVSDDSAYLGDATGYDKQGTYVNLDGSGSFAGEMYRTRWNIEDLGLDSRSLVLDGSRAGALDYRLAYRELPRRQFNTTSTVFEQSGALLALPGSWTRAPATSGFSNLEASLTPLNVEGDRTVLDIGAGYRTDSHWAISANYQRREQDGTRMVGGSYFTNAAILPAVIDHVTDEVDVGIRYSNDRSVLVLGWYLSDFENGQSAISWQHPFTTVPGGEFAALAEAPDSRFQQLTFSGSHTFSALRATASFSAAMGKIEQDDSLLPYTSNLSLTVPPLPRSNLAGEVDTTRLALAVSARPIRKARVKLTYRYDERDNSTARDAWSRIRADSFVSSDIATNVPYSYERSVIGARADYKLIDNVTVSAGYDRRDSDYDFQEVAEQSEDAGWGQIRWQALPSLQFEVRGGAAKRDIDRYNEVFAVALGQNPLLRKYNLAYRYRQYGELSVSYSPANLPVSLAVDARYADDSYTKSRIGLSGDDELRVGADLNWTVSDNASIYLNVGLEDISSTQFGSERLGDRDWRATIDDDFVTVGGGFLVREIADKFDVRLDYTRTDGGSDTAIDSDSDDIDHFPEISTRFDQLNLRLSYQRSEQLQLHMALRYQRFKTEDWALEGVTPAALPVVLGLGAQPYSPEHFIVGVGFRYHVGPKKASSSAN